MEYTVRGESRHADVSTTLRNYASKFSVKMDAWTQFFIRAGIPKDIAQKYAKSFQNNRITKEMLPELDKSTLSELGVTAIGDQLCILRRIKAAKSAIERNNEPEMLEEEPKTSKIRITAPETSSASSSASELRRGKPPPDRNEIYHVKMPSGNTHRTRQIMQKAEKMRQQGLAVRGTTGVRQGGRSVSPIDKTSLAARLVKKQSSEVSSSTDRGSKISRIGTSSIKKTITNRPSITSRLSSASRPPGIEIRMDGATSGIRGRLQKSTGLVVTSSSRGRRAADVRIEYEDDDDDMEYEEEQRVVYEPRRGAASRSVFSRVSFHH